jgi:hypothetical protein
MVISTTLSKNLSELAVALRQMEIVRGFSLSPTGD